MNYQFSHLRYHLPFRTPVRTAHGLWSHREGVLVRLIDEQERVTYGEAAPIPWFGTETVEEVCAECERFGATVDDARLDEGPATLGCLRAALSSARVGAPEPTNQEPRMVAALLPSGRAALALIELKAEAGFRVFKWKVGVGDASDEMTLLDDLCARLPAGGKLRLDANGAWDHRTAARWLGRCANYPVEFVEQPIMAARVGDGALRGKVEDTLLGLAGDFPTPLALDESVVSGQDVTRWLALGWSGYFVVKPSLMGDVQGALAALAKAQAKVIFSSALETAVGAKAGLRTAFGWAGSGHALGFGVGPLFIDSCANGPASAPFIGWEEVERIDEGETWNVLN